MTVLSQLQLSSCLRSRINHDTAAAVSAAEVADDPSTGFVLYLPTVNLRLEHNPAFAVACHAANHLKLPLVVLAVVCDDASHHSNSPLGNGGVVMTSRRLAFTLQALSHACNQWSRHGAAVGVRVHGPNGARVPDHLTLASNASFVVTDESFVSPYTTITRRVKEACRKSKVQCISVDGSTTVPPIQVLKRNRNQDAHLKAAMQGEFCAPELRIKLEDEDLFHPILDNGVSSSPTLAEKLAHLFPRRWKPTSLAYSDNQLHSLPSCPDVRPFTSAELNSLFRNDDHYKNNEATTVAAAAAAAYQSQLKSEDSSVPFFNFSMQWNGADHTVPPCEHTIGTSPCGMSRWNAFVQKGGLLRYGKERNNAKLVHSVSRMSAYLNLGIVSIFRLVSEVKRAQRQAQGNMSHKSCIDKFLQEIVKFERYPTLMHFLVGRTTMALEAFLDGVCRL
ncbi:deoxyribodipyrimidine photo-lyase [Skeletonema marinoi]|uniref:Deoxyribodipyrimidine photo-lyase n=1 Tax=Skeletonema marinoi TaxID=267567 RepID=A0AAD8YHI9_9STRA|nr:deoxyribodipyrimidine photo-lyase [Skeletonema marinoi]